MKNGQGWPRVRLLSRQFNAYVPRFCCFCHRKTDTGRDLCKFCDEHLPSLGPLLGPVSGPSLCLRCGMEGAYQESVQSCAFCVNHRSAIGTIAGAYRYDFPIDYLIGRLKYGQHLPTGRLLGSLLARAVCQQIDPDQLPDVLVPVPLSLDRHRDRGFNHATEIAKGCALELGLECAPGVVGRHFDTASLAGLSRSERAMQIRGAFWVDDCLCGKRVAIIDDVLTTGATSGELSTELQDSGIEDMQLWVVARTPRYRPCHV